MVPRLLLSRNSPLLYIHRTSFSAHPFQFDPYPTTVLQSFFVGLKGVRRIFLLKNESRYIPRLSLIRNYLLSQRGSE